jgi:hypothetical protein
LESSPVDPGRKKGHTEGLLSEKLGAPEFEPRMAFYLLPYPASVGSTNGT